MFLYPPTDKYTSQFGTGNQYAYYHDEDESTFHLVDTARVQKPIYQRGRFRGNMRNLRFVSLIYRSPKRETLPNQVPV